jgi:hypothetical protein
MSRSVLRQTREGEGAIQCHERLSGLLKYYYRQVACRCYPLEASFVAVEKDLSGRVVELAARSTSGTLSQEE